MLSVDGYDLKAGEASGAAFTRRGARSGMHTFDNAFLMVREGELPNTTITLPDVAAGILSRLGVSADVDGSRCF